MRLPDLQVSETFVRGDDSVVPEFASGSDICCKYSDMAGTKSSVTGLGTALSEVSNGGFELDHGMFSCTCPDNAVGVVTLSACNCSICGKGGTLSR